MAQRVPAAQPLSAGLLSLHDAWGGNCLKLSHWPLQVCKVTGVDPSDIQYVEAHGTGTVVGDSQELMAIDGLYGAGAGHTPEEPLLIGSVKSNMGHCEGCSGLAGKATSSQLPLILARSMPCEHLICR